MLPVRDESNGTSTVHDSSASQHYAPLVNRFWPHLPDITYANPPATKP
jgi:hypothetical protein